MNRNLKKLIYAALCLALSVVLPAISRSVMIPIPSGSVKLAQILSPMHIPVLLCGFLCGWPWGLAVGVIAPILNSFITGGMFPALYPQAFRMVFELAAYGTVSGLLYRRLPKKPWSVYVALIVAMLAGRLAWGLANLLVLILSGSVLTFEVWLMQMITETVTKTSVGIVIHIILIPIIVFALDRAGLIERTKRRAEE